MKPLKIQLKKNREFALIKGHPWVYADAVKDLPDNICTGSFVQVRSHKDRLAGYGYTDLESKILVRMVPAGENESPRQVFKRLVCRAISLRKQIFNTDETDSFRLINGEGDFIPGLIADYYAGAVSLQIYSKGLEPFLEPIVETIIECLPQVKWIYRRNQIRIAETDKEGLIKGSNMPAKIRFRENGLNFVTDLVNGQKTGFFLDQRDNRQLIRTLAEDKRFLNVCGYTGAFTVAAAAGKASSSVTVDIAAPALEEAKNNLAANNFSGKNHSMVCADMYKFLQGNQDEFDLVVLDPPSMARSRKDRFKALKAYSRLNLLGLKAVSHEGYLFTASCSSQISREDFYGAVFDAVLKAKVNAQIVKESFHALDHPVSICHSEGRYLKGLLLRIFKK
jgi:23S rRNA (cytosine1962-C5)-methyltransferase